MSSFCLPNAPPDSELFRLRDAPIQRGDLLYKYLSEERQALEEYVRKNGCALVLDPYRGLKLYAPSALKLRFNTLLAFLEDESIANVRVVVRTRHS